MHTQHFALFNLNLKFCAKDSFSLLLILLGLRRSLWSLSAAPIQVPGCFRRLQAGPGETAGPTLQGLHLLQSAVKITLLYHQPSSVKMFNFFSSVVYGKQLNCQALVVYIFTSQTSPTTRSWELLSFYRA